MRDSQLTAHIVLMTCGATYDFDNDTDIEIDDMLEEIEEEMNNNEFIFVDDECVIKAVCPFCDGIGCVRCDDLGLIDESSIDEVHAEYEVVHADVLFAVDRLCDEALAEMTARETECVYI